MDTTRTTLTGAQLDSLAALHTRTIDARAGFETMMEKAEPQFRPVARRFHDLHDVHASELAALLSMHGRTPDHDGSLMATVNTAVVAARAVFDEIDEELMDRIRDGEKHLLDAMDEARAALPAQPAAEAVERMRRELAMLLDETRHLG